jgi:hypothetical protein
MPSASFAEIVDDTTAPAPVRGSGGKARFDDIIDDAPEPGLLSRAITRPLSSVVPKKTQAKVVGAILGHDVTPADEDPTLAESLAAAKESPLKAAGGVAAGLTGVPAIYDLLKTAYETGPDIARGLVNNPLETIRGGVAGVAEGAMQQATPMNALLLLMGARGRGEAAAPHVAETNVRAMPDLQVPREMPGLVKSSMITPEKATLGKRAVSGPGKIVGKAQTLSEVLQDALNANREQPAAAASAPKPFERAPAVQKALDAMQGDRKVPPMRKDLLDAMPVGENLDTLAQSGELGKFMRGAEAPSVENLEGRPLGKAAKDIAERRVANVKPPPGVSERRYSELLAKYGGKQEDTYTAGTLNKFAEMMGAKGAKIDEGIDVALKSGHVEHAANAIEEKVKLSVAELAQKMRDQYGSERAGKMMQPNKPAKIGAAQIKRLAPGPSKMPQIVKDAIQESGGLMKNGTKAQQAGYATTLGRFSNEGGAIDPKLMMAGGGAVAGAAIGATRGETGEERFTNAALGGITGAVAVPLLAHVAASSTPASKKLQSYIYSSVLSSPQSVAKAYLGGAGGAIAAGLEKIAAGDVANGSKIITELFSPKHISRMTQAFRSGGEMATGRTEAAPSIVGRVFDSVNEPAVKAMEAGGISREDAIRYTLSGVPTTQMGQDILGLWSRYFPLRLATSLFPRVGVQVLERGMERSPVGLLNLKGINEGASTATKVARAAAGTSAAVGAYAGADQVPDWAKPYLVALSGVYGLPVAAGMAVAGKQGKGVKAQVMAGVQSVTQNMPFPQFGPAEAFNPDAIASLMIPNAARDVARAMDPNERDTRGRTFGRAQAKIPILREQLPIKGRNVNIAGKPNDDRTSATKRALTPAPGEQKSMKDIPPAVTRELSRLDIPINSPAFEKKIKIGQREIAVPADAAERARAERRQFLVPQIEKLIASDSYQRADDSQKAARLRAVVQRAETAGSQRARAQLVRTLRENGALRGSR